MSYADEYQTALQSIATANSDLRSLRYFLNTAIQWHAIFDQDVNYTSHSGASTPLVVVLGHGIPEQLVRACGATPLHLPGGSHESCQWSDDVMPRDSDPASRSILGYALRLAARSDLDPLFVVPVENDNMRKVAYHLKREGHAVLSIDIPPVVTSATQRAWERSAIELVQTIRRHMGTRVTARSILQADREVGVARVALIDFERTCVECYGALSDEARLFVTGTYYQTQSLVQWTAQLKDLTADIKARYRTMGRPSSCAPRILVVGSPVLFPQYKVPDLIHDAGLRLQATVDASSTSRFAMLTARERHGGVECLVRAIARKHYALDSSCAHVVNHAMEHYVEFLLSSTEVDGVVCHILKGQIEYDFMLARMEPLFERYDIPVFRLETDYQYQDVEQLRIRLEAFAEMLEQRKLSAIPPLMRCSA